MQQKTMIVSLMVLLFSAATSGFGANDENAEVKGMITSRTGEAMIVKSAEGNRTVVLTESTRTKDNKGLFGRW